MGKYYMPDPDDGGFKTLLRWMKTGVRPRPFFPRAIQIQTTTRCNAKCLFCGYKHIYKDLPQGDMDDDLCREIIDECCGHFVTRISPYLMNEPLMDKKIADRIAYISKKKKPGTRTKINSNGALLDEDMARGLIKAGLTQLWLSIQGYSEETYGNIMGLNLRRTLDNIDRFLDIRSRLGAKRPELVITTVLTKQVEAEIDYARKYWGDRGIRFKVHHMDNRSGANLTEIGATGKPQAARNCQKMLNQAYIIYNGDVLICCHDWRRTVVLGNLRESSIGDIWNSRQFKELIYQYARGDFGNLELCRNCASF